jgi:hypothetical protein
MTYVHAVPPDQPPPPQLTNQDEQNLRLLSVLFYVYACFVAFSALVCGAVSLMGLWLMPLIRTSSGQELPKEALALFGGVFLLVFGLAALLMLVQCVVMVLAGRACGRRSGYVVCLVAACLSLLHIPLGTALGVFALITLSKPAVRDVLQSAPLS